MEDTSEQIKKQYTLHFILKPGLGSEETHNYRQVINDKVSALDGKIEASICQETARRLAYPIGKEQQGYLCESVFSLAPEKVKSLYEDLKQESNIIRHVIEVKRPIKASAKLRARKERRRPGVQASEEKESVPPRRGGVWLPESDLDKPKESVSREVEKRGKISAEEIDKKLDEIIKNI